MDIEFHYYQTFLIAAKAGFAPEEAEVIAYASQYGDDNDMVFEIHKDTAHYFRNYISQTVNILKPKNKLLRIYPLFHFIPGDLFTETVQRKDGRYHLLNTTPDSSHANAIFDMAVNTADLYRIGIATHAYVDTWAHQNFIGYYDDFNAMRGVLESASPDIGHADARHNPDRPGLVWKDVRLHTDLERIDNRARFLEAADALFRKLSAIARPGIEGEQLEREARELVEDLTDIMEERDPHNQLVDERIGRCCAFATDSAYGQVELKRYDPDAWFDAVVKEKVRGLRDRNTSNLFDIEVFADEYTWKDVDTYRDSHWYRFQNAVKAHQKEGMEYLNEHVFSLMELESL